MILLVACARAPGPMYVHFDTAVDVPKDPQEHVTVGMAAQQLKDDGALHAVVIGHADARGADEINRNLSFRRARNVRTLLVGAGIPDGRIRVGARGEAKPVASNHTEEGRAQNRRTEIFFYYAGDGDPRVQYEARFGVSIELQTE